jgi:hypothetical protein
LVPPSRPSSERSFAILSASPNVDCSTSSSFSFVCRFARRFDSSVRSSSSLLSAGTCFATESGEKSSRLRKLRSTPSFGASASSLSLFSTENWRCGFMLASTSSKLSGVTSTNLRSFSLARGSVGCPVKSPRTPIRNGSSFISIAPPVSTS